MTAAEEKNVTRSSVQCAEPRTAVGRPSPFGLDLRTRKQIRAVVVRALEVLLIAGGLLATGAISAFITFSMTIRGNEVPVPDLVGNNLTTAGQVLARSELNLRHEGDRFDETIAPDLVAAQSPPAGAALKKGRTVKVWISLGPKRRVVPRIEGEALPSAQLLLGQDGFTLGRVVEVHTESYAPDTVIAQDPPAYGEAGETTEVAVLLSRGYVEQAYVMPDFIGHQVSEVLDSARRGSLGISSIRYVEYSGVSHGTVVRQSPPAGAKVYPRDRIVVFVSKGD